MHLTASAKWGVVSPVLTRLCMMCVWVKKTGRKYKSYTVLCTYFGNCGRSDITEALLIVEVAGIEAGWQYLTSFYICYASLQ